MIRILYLYSLFCLLACGSKASHANTPNIGTTACPNTLRISIKNVAFNPTCITVAKGSTVTFSNDETNGTAHTATAMSGDSFDSGLLNPGQTYQHTFTKAGTVSMDCDVHGTLMTLQVDVI